MQKKLKDFGGIYAKAQKWSGRIDKGFSTLPFKLGVEKKTLPGSTARSSFYLKENSSNL